jgi:hypothetical protein
MKNRGFGLRYALALGAAGGFAAAALVIAYPGSPVGLLLLRPFAFLGFVLGNVHQGNGEITVASFFGTAIVLGGACAGFIYFLTLRARGR